MSYLAVAAADFPEIDDYRLVSGQFNDVILVGEELALRFPRTAAALADLPRVAGLLGTLQVGVETPRPILERYANRTVGQAFLALSYVRGESWRPEWTVPIDDFSTLLSRMSTVDSLDGLAPRPDWREFATNVRRHLFPLMSAAGRDRATAELDGLLKVNMDGPATLVHGDLGGDNLRFVDGSA